MCGAMLSRDVVVSEMFQRVDAAFNPWPAGRLLTQEEINALNVQRAIMTQNIAGYWQQGWRIHEGMPMTREEWCEEGKKVVQELRMEIAKFKQERDQAIVYPWEKEPCPSPEVKRKSGGRLKDISQILATPMTWLKRKLIER